MNRHGEVTIERRHAGESTTATDTKGPVQSREEFKIPLNEGFIGSLLLLQKNIMSFLSITIVVAIDSTEVETDRMVILGNGNEYTGNTNHAYLKYR